MITVTGSRQGRLSSQDLETINAWWAAANYQSVGQIYLLDNPPSASLDAGVEASLNELVELAPLPQPKSLAALDAVSAALPGCPRRRLL
jgi:hypothetical protein